MVNINVCRRIRREKGECNVIVWMIDKKERERERSREK
jgi:hypothetical protein